MTCFEGLVAEPALWMVAGVSGVAALAFFWMMKFQRFQGKSYYALTFLAMIWTLVMIGFEAASSTFSCQLQWATMAWLGNALLPVAWCFFVFAYIDDAAWLKKRRVGLVLIFVPLAIFAFAATNQWHKLFYTAATFIPPGEVYIDYAHGPGFYGILATMYAFVLATLFCIMRGFTRAKHSAWPLLTMLLVITMTPLVANAAYVGFGFTVFGLDPTAFMFTLGFLPFTWMLLTNRTLDMASVGQSILFNTMSEPVILIDRYRNAVKMNTAARRIERHQGAGRLLSDLLANNEKLNTAENAVHMTIGQRIYEPRVREIQSPLDPSGAGLGWSITFVDITDRIAISAELEEALKRADDASRSKDDFISVVSHELRTPLTSLTGGLTLALSGRLGDVPDPIRSLLNISHRNGIRLSRLVDNILLAQKIDINALTLESGPVDLGQLLEESFEENKMFASERGVRLHLGSIMPAVVTGDAFAIRQIVDNIISNAIKFSDDNGVVEGVLSTFNGQVRLSINNAGRGIPEGMESQVFGRFEQVENSGQSSTQGSGLGLHISKKLAQQMSGNIFYESQVGVDTTFHVEFQLADHQAIEPAKHAR